MNSNGMVLTDLLNQAQRGKIAWQPYSADGRDGVEIFRLYDAREANQGPAAALLRYKAGARVKRHVHAGYELIFVIEGALINDTGVHRAGTLEICPPGSTHALASEEGCVFLVVWEQPVRVAPEGNRQFVTQSS
jgi:anti-sigma factor ChrR (cupin superfamily)